MPVEAEAEAAQVAPGVLVKVEGMKGSSESGLEVAHQRVDPAELRQVVGVLATGHNSLLVAVGCRHGSEAGQAIGQHLAAGHQMAFGPFSDLL